MTCYIINQFPTINQTSQHTIFSTQTQCLTMSFLKHINNPSRLYFIFGLRPFAIDTHANRAHTTQWHTIYSLIYSCTLAYLIPVITYNAFYRDRPIREHFANIFQVVQNTETVLVLFIFYVQLLMSFKDRAQHVKLLNRLCESDEKFTEFFGKESVVQLNGNLYWPIVVPLCYWLIICVAMVTVNGSINIYMAFQRMGIGIMTITMSSIVVYIRYLGSVILARLVKLTDMAARLTESDPKLTMDRQSVVKIIALLDCYYKVKRKFYKVVGRPLLMNATFDVLMLTVSTYALFSCRRYHTNSILLYLVLVDILPQLVKNWYLVWTMSLMGRQVNDI